MNSKKTILMSGYYGFDNSGDDAILKAIIKDIKAQNQDIDIVVLSKDPEKTKKTYEVDAINRFKFKELIRGMKNTSLLVSGGGSLLQDVTSTRSLLYYLAVIFLGKFYRKPIMIYANGIGPINGSFNRFLTKFLLNRVDLITLRDLDSYDYLNKMGVYNKNIEVTADPVFTLKPIDENQIKKILLDEKIPLGKKYIGISLRKWKKINNLEIIIREVIEDILDKYNVEVILIPMHYPEDLTISEEIAKDIDSRCHVLKNKYSVEEIMGIISKLDLIVAMRLHSLIYAACQEIPMVGLVYDPKVDGLLKSLGMENKVDVESLEKEELIRNIDKAWINRGTLKTILRDQDSILKKKALLNVELALGLLKGED